jgi:hypothetical protein
MSTFYMLHIQAFNNFTHSPGADPGIFKGRGPTLSKIFSPNFYSPELEKQK